MKISENVPIAELTTMRLGGVARYVVEIERPEDIAAAYNFARERNLPTWIMGEGANTIGRDEGFSGVIILNRLKGIFVEQDGRLINVENLDDGDFGEEITLIGMGGENWDDFVEFAARKGYTGIEAMSMIPGTVGAAPVQNIGAYGQDLAGVIESVEAYDTELGEIITLEPSEMRMGYRTTRFNTGEDAGRFLIISVKVKLKRGELKPPFYNSLQRYIDEHKVTDFSPLSIRKMVCEIRDQKLPNPKKVASAGSFFKNVRVEPEKVAEIKAQNIPVWENADRSGKINTGWLIEACGLKGKKMHGFLVSDKAALVLINEDAKHYADLEAARREIIEAVKKKFGFTIEQEPVELYHETNNIKNNYAENE